MLFVKHIHKLNKNHAEKESELRDLRLQHIRSENRIPMSTFLLPKLTLTV